eukprot:CAMPEP_0206583782 /NCGR_PEP_ID=MMETSP0325_2-20121206/35316_1 /ASSEMBLY_ACC=CAM_ASM_000347 /TAXON_ID=2866 /ORGANISM="Crypthecodinium cohnii, Strain Seligo" /LENGTH=91 /DNA_ID=CAMNT_0054090783 /DNA_START=306 /DNA_END=581 /DNA_ORIENTATION=+
MFHFLPTNLDSHWPAAFRGRRDLLPTDAELTNLSGARRLRTCFKNSSQLVKGLGRFMIALPVGQAVDLNTPVSDYDPPAVIETRRDVSQSF